MSNDIQRGERLDIMHRFVKHNGVIYFAGLVSLDATLSMRGQTEQITQRLDNYLALAGTSKERLLTATIYVTDLGLRPEMNEAWKAWISDEDLPARATIGVADLGPGTLIEVVVTAAA